MILIGVCGGIGSGKSVVVKLFNRLYGYAVFDSDIEAKKLYYQDGLRQSMVKLFGLDPISAKGILKREELCTLLSNKSDRQRLESLVHQELQFVLSEWSRQVTPYHEIAFLESAILYTSGYYKECNYVIAVEAEKEQRYKWVQKRDGVAGQQRFEMIEALQQDEAILRRERADFVIENNAKRSLIQQVEELRGILLQQARR